MATGNEGDSSEKSNTQSALSPRCSNLIGENLSKLELGEIERW